MHDNEQISPHLYLPQPASNLVPQASKSQVVLKQPMAINQGKFFFVIFVIVLQNQSGDCRQQEAHQWHAKPLMFIQKNLGRLFAVCAFGAKVIKTNPAHRPIKAQFMANRWMRSLGAIHAFTNRTANTNLVKACRFGNINLIGIDHIAGMMQFTPKSNSEFWRLRQGWRP